MNKLQEQLKTILAEFDALELKNSSTPDDMAKLASLLKEAEDVQTAIQTAAKRDGIGTWLKELSPADQKTAARIAAPDNAVGTTWSDESVAATFQVGETYAGKTSIKIAEGFQMELTEAQARAISEPSYKSAWLRYVMRGKRLDAADFKTITEGEDTEGGYLVPPEILAEILRRDPHPTSVVDMVRRVPFGSDVLKLPRNNYTTDDIYGNPYRIEWAGERANPASSTDISWGEWRCDVHEGYMKIPITRSVLEDASFDLGAYVSEEMRMSYRSDLEKFVVSSSGNGVNKPFGILFDPGGSFQPPTVNIGNAVTADGLKDLDNALPPQYDGNAVVVMNKTNVYATLSKLTKTDMGYVFGSVGQNDNNLAGGPVKSLLGKPIVFSAHMPNGAAGAAVAINGDLRKGYLLAERVAMSIRVEDLPSSATVQIVARLRVGGQVFQSRALRVGIQT